MKIYLLSSIILLTVTIDSVLAQTPTDPYYPYQFYLDMMNVEDAWEITKGDPSVIIIMLDSGFDHHEDLDLNNTLGLSQTWKNNAPTSHPTVNTGIWIAK